MTQEPQSRNIIKLIRSLFRLALLALFLFGIGYIIQNTHFIDWMTNEMSEGVGAFLAGITGFLGLILVAWWSGRQNTQALVKTAKYDRELEAIQAVRKAQENAAVVFGILHTYRGLCASMLLYLSEEEGITEDIARNEINKFRVLFLPGNHLRDPVFVSNPEFLKGLILKHIANCLNVGDMLDSIRFTLSQDEGTYIERFCFLRRRLVDLHCLVKETQEEMMPEDGKEMYAHMPDFK